jgi:hypothetical protein
MIGEPELDVCVPNAGVNRFMPDGRVGFDAGVE